MPVLAESFGSDENGGGGGGGGRGRVSKTPAENELVETMPPLESNASFESVRAFPRGNAGAPGSTDSEALCQQKAAISGRPA